MSISAAADAVIKMLKAEMPPLLKPEQVGLCLPTDNGDKFLLGVFVYAIARDMKAQINGDIRVDASSLIKAPLNVEMRIAVTSYAGKKSGLADDYKILERVMRLWHVHGELPMTTALQPAHIAAPRVDLLSLEQDEITKIWQFADTAYLLSLFYRIAPVAISSGIQSVVSPVGVVDYTGGKQ